MESLDLKQRQLEDYLEGLGSIVIAFSGGVDSTYLLTIASRILGRKAIAVTARSLSFPERELEEAKAYAAQLGVRHLIVDSEELDIDGFSHNPVNRCYICKTALFTKIREVIAAADFPYIAEGSNKDDEGDYRPGLQAVAELGILSPLRRAGLHKDEIRELSARLQIPTWDKPSFACLSSRFPYGEEITAERLMQVDKAEQLLLDAGFKQVRVRHHGELARIETDGEGFRKMESAKLRGQIYDQVKQLGFTYVALDLIGYRTGSMNETLNKFVKIT